MSATQHEFAVPPAPPHVPKELVRLFDFKTALGDRPHEAVATLHGGLRIFYTPALFNTAATGSGSWILTRAEDIRAVFLDPETFSSHAFTGMSAAIGESWLLAPLEVDPPDHSRYRAALHPHFLQKPIKALAPRVRKRAAEFIGVFAKRGECDIVNDFARIFPTSVFLELLGLPLNDLPLFMEWERKLIHSRDSEERIEAVRKLKDFMAARIAELRRNPGDDILSRLMQADAQGEPFDDDELLGMSILLFAAGLDTVPNSLSAQFRHVAEHPDLQDKVRSQTVLIPKMVEELLRLYSPVSPFRTATRDTQLAGVTIKAGDRVMLPTVLGSRDPHERGCAEEARLERIGEPRHLAFGFGIHHCIGAHLARLEMGVAWEEWFRLIPSRFAIKPRARIMAHGGSVLGIGTLPVVW